MSLATRGSLLLVGVTLTALGPFGVASYWRAAAEQRIAGETAAALLACGLDAHLKSTRTATAGAAVVELAKAGSRIRWAAACERSGTCIEFVRRFAIPAETIAAQIDFDRRQATLRPFELPGQAPGGLQLLTIADGRPDVLLAAVVELDTDTAAAARAADIALVAGPAAALLLGVLVLRYAIVRPVRRLSTGVEQAETALRACTAGDAIPAELAALVQRVQESEQELSRWRGEAGALRQSLERRLEARTADVTRALRQAERAADTDPLTQLANRRVLERELPGMFATQRANGDELSVIWFDVDNFKPFNDRRGHAAGDELVCFAARLLCSAARREGDLAVRYGGDEFVLVLRGTALHEAAYIARRLARLFDQHVRTLGDVPAPPGLSAGVASLQRSAPRDAAHLLSIADAAMYEAKRSARDVVTADRTPR